MEISNQQQRVSDIISTEDIAGWTVKDLVLITAGTGQGKSYFVLHKLYEYAQAHDEQILYLSNRTALKRQVKQATRGKSHIDIWSYQQLQNAVNEYCASEMNLAGYLMFSCYDYMVCDEAHYFCADAEFNNMTDLAYNIIMDCGGIKRIFMTATPAVIDEIIAKSISDNGLNQRSYYLPPDYSKIDSLTFYDDKNLPEKILRRLPQEQKAIVFCKSAEDAYRLYCIFKDESLFVCSRHNKKYYEYVNKEGYDYMIENEKFAERFLFATKAIDNGVNIKDDSVRTIICDQSDITTLIQCVGRKRLAAHDGVFDLYVHRYTNNQLGGWIAQIKERIDAADLFVNDRHKYIKENCRGNMNVCGMLYYNPEDEKYYLNPLKYNKAKYDLKVYTEMVNRDAYGFCTYVAEVFDKYTIDDDGNKYYNYRIDNEPVKELNGYLFSLTEGNTFDEPVYIFKDDRPDFIKKIGYRKKKGGYYRRIIELNKYISELGLDYTIKQTEIDRRIAWYVVYKDYDSTISADVKEVKQEYREVTSQDEINDLEALLRDFNGTLPYDD